MRLLLGFTLLGVCGGVLSWKAAEVELQRGVSNVADSLDTLQDFLGHLGDVTADMLKSTGKITEAASSIECSGSELDDYLDDVSYVNASVADVAAIFDDMIDPVDTAEDQVRSNGRRYVRLVVPVALAAPFALYVLFALCGVGVSKASRAPVSASCCMNTGAIWAGAVGLPVALVVLVVLLVLSVAFSDFCYVGPAAVLTADNEDNQYIAYYLRCEGANAASVASSLGQAVDVDEDRARRRQGRRRGRRRGRRAHAAGRRPGRRLRVGDGEGVAVDVVAPRVLDDADLVRAAHGDVRRHGERERLARARELLVARGPGACPSPSPGA
jgi:hypothetical protein